MGEIMSNKIDKDVIKFLYKHIFIILKSDEDKSTKKNKIIELLDGAVK
jgi:hypothetical protein